MATTHSLISRVISLSAAAFVLAALNTVGFAQNTGPVLPPSNAVVGISITEADPAGPVSSAATAGKSTAPAQWTDIKDCTSKMRSQFFSGLKHLEIIINNQIADLTAKRAAMPRTLDTTALDAAIREISNNRFFLIALGEKLNRATAEAWEQQKAKVGLAWVKSQAVYAKINSDLTS